MKIDRPTIDQLDELLSIFESLDRFWVEHKVISIDWDTCMDQCPGWALFKTSRGLELQRCDECRRFWTDTDAFKHAIRNLRELGLLGKASCGCKDCEDCFVRQHYSGYEPDKEITCPNNGGIQEDRPWDTIHYKEH